MHATIFAALGEPSRLVEVGSSRLAPDQVRVGGISQAAGNGGVHAVGDVVEDRAVPRFNAIV